MEQDRLRREQEEKEKAEKAKKIKEEWADPNSQWEKDKIEMQNLASQEKSSKSEKVAVENQKDTVGAGSDSKDTKGAEAAPAKAAAKKNEEAQAQPKEQS
jgi:mannan polymerase II complex ANP1 subunit